jgi:hypothetical protein
MAFRLSTSSKTIRRNQGNSNAKFAITPHQCSEIMVKQTRKGNNWKLGRAHNTIYKQLEVDIQAASIHRRSQSLRAATRGDVRSIYPKMEYNQKFGSQSLV